MTKKQSYHPIILIRDHFENIKNHVNSKIERIVEDDNLNDNTRAEISHTWQRQLDKIEEIKNINLNNWSCHSRGKTFGYDSDLELIKESLIVNDCVAVEDPSSKTKLSIWITDWYYNSNSLAFLK